MILINSSAFAVAWTSCMGAPFDVGGGVEIPLYSDLGRPPTVANDQAREVA
jgi:hypothetical protein